MVCKKCGRNVKGDFKFCPYCGERLVSDFHDHYSELDPPFLVQEPDGPDTASDFYTYAPDEQEPDFGAFDDYDAYEQEMPHGRAADDDSYFLILLILALAAGVTIFGYYLLRSPAPFESFDLAATFAVFPPF